MRLTSRNIFSCLAAVLAAAAIIGCGGIPSAGNFFFGTIAPSVPYPSAGYVYVIQNPPGGTGQVLAFLAGANGSATPAVTLTAPAGMSITAVTTDISRSLYVAGYLATSSFPVIEVYASGASGAATPARTIVAADLYAPTAMTVDSAGSLYTVNPNDGEVFVYSSTASGAATPTRIISGALTQLNYSTGISVDVYGTIYVASTVFNSMAGNAATGAVYEFSSTANGNVAPANVLLNPNGAILGEALDRAGNIYLTVDTISAPLTGSIVEYTRSASGLATPIRTIAGAGTGLVTAGGVSVDDPGNIYVADEAANGNGFTYELDEFAPTATGNVAPVDSFTSTSWTNAASGIATR